MDRNGFMYTSASYEIVETLVPLRWGLL